MTPTRVSSLVAIFLGCAALSWGALRVAEARGAVLPILSWTSPLGIGCLAVGVLVAAIALRGRLRGRPGTKPPQPLGVARMAVLGKTSAHVGAILGGLYTGWALVLLPSLDIEARRDRTWITLGAVLASVLLTGAGLLLERICRVPPPDDAVPPPAR